MAELSRNEHIKEASDYLRGTLAEGLSEEITGAIVEDDQQLVKFHGMYLQDDRDLRGGERWPDRLRQEVLNCRVLLAVVGPGWLTALDEDGRRRLDDPQD